MKAVYEAPEATLIAFAATTAVAADWDWSRTVEGFSSDSDIDADFGNNPEGDFWN